VLRLATFTALAAYGLVRWSELITPVPGWRLFGLLALGVTAAGLGPWLRRLSGPAALVLALAVVIAVFPIAGIPLSWVRHVRLAVTADGIGQGLSALPGVLLPYAGISEWVRIVVLLGAAVLLLDSALMLTFAPPDLGELRRASAALPLVALAIVPATLVRPKAPYLQGLLLFALLAAFMWGERLRRPAAASSLGVAAAAAAVAMVLAPALDTHTPWFNYRAWAGTIASGRVDSFNWTQTYGPLRWPRHDRAVLQVRAKTRGLLEGREPRDVRRNRMDRDSPTQSANAPVSHPRLAWALDAAAADHRARHEDARRDRVGRHDQSGRRSRDRPAGGEPGHVDRRSGARSGRQLRSDRLLSASLERPTPDSRPGTPRPAGRTGGCGISDRPTQQLPDHRPSGHTAPHRAGSSSGRSRSSTPGFQSRASAVPTVTTARAR